ncbi:Exocyst complex component Sec3 PIP2-binding N-terminal domain-containing protein [Entamoeba marina]
MKILGKNPIKVTGKFLGNVTKKVGGGVVNVASMGKKTLMNPFDMIIGSAEERDDVMYLFRGKTVVTFSYGSLISTATKESNFSVLVLSYEGSTCVLNFVKKIKSIDVQDGNTIAIGNTMKKEIRNFSFTNALNKAEFILALLTKAQELEIPIECNVSFETLSDIVEKEKKRQGSQNELQIVSEEDEKILKNILQMNSDRMDIDDLQKTLEKQIVFDEAELFKNYLTVGDIGDNVNDLFNSTEEALNELNRFCLKLDVDVENIRPGVELIQYNNNKLELVHSNQTAFSNTLNSFVDSLIIDSMSVYIVQNCSEDLVAADPNKLSIICDAAQKVANAAFYKPPEEMMNMESLIEQTIHNKAILTEFASQLSQVLQKKLIVEMDFLMLSKVKDFGHIITGKDGKKKESMEIPHIALKPYGGLIYWLQQYAPDEFKSVKTQYITKMKRIAGEYFSYIADIERKRTAKISKTHSELLDLTDFDGPKIDGIQSVLYDTFIDEDPKHPDHLPMFDIVRNVILTIANEAMSEFKFLKQVFRMKENEADGINVMIDDVYHQTFDICESLVKFIYENDPFILLKIIHMCRTTSTGLNFESIDFEKRFDIEEHFENKLKIDETKDNTTNKDTTLVDFTWLEYFFDVVSSHAMKCFNNHMQEQIRIITHTIINPKKHGVTNHFKRFPFFFNYLQSAAGDEEVWSVINPLIQDSLEQMLRRSFDWLKNIKDLQRDQKPTMTLRYQNFYYFQDTISSRVITAVDPFIKEAQKEQLVALKNVCVFHLRLHFGKFFDYFDSIARLLPSQKRPEEVSFQSSYNRQQFLKICNIVQPNNVEKAVNYICRSIKHHILMQSHRDFAWTTFTDFLAERYKEAEKNSVLVYKNNLPFKSEDFDRIFTNAVSKTYRDKTNGEDDDEEMYSDTTYEN